MRAADIEKLVSVSRPAVAPDGSFAVYATSRPDVAANRAVGQLWRIDLPGGAPRRLTRGIADRAPRLSPDGTVVAFLRGDAKGSAQIHVVPALGGEPVQVTDAPLGVSSFVFSPDGGAFAYLALVPEKGRYGTVDGLGAASESPRRVTGLRWHANGLGYTLDRPSHVFVVPVPDAAGEPFYAPAPRVAAEGEEPPTPRVVPAEATALTSGAVWHDLLAFTPDGTEVITSPSPIVDERIDLRSRLVAVRVDGGGEREVLGLDAGYAIDEVVASPDGALFVLGHTLGDSHVDFIAPGVALGLVDEGSVRLLTDPDALDLGEPGSAITLAGDDVLVQNRTRGRVELVRVTRAGVTSVLLADAEVTGVGADAAGARVIAAIAAPDTFGALVEIDGDGDPRRIVDLGGELRASGVVTPVETQIAARDGYPVHGWVAVPEGDGPFPVILQIHGGPFAQYGVHVFDETQVLVDSGYAVVYCNPRGSAGYGRAHGRSIRQAMGTVDFTDVIDFLEAALAADARLDGTRLGVQGGSYGGYLTAWVIAHDHRFAGAIVERGFLDPEAFVGTSDIGSFFGQEYVGTDPALVASQSPAAVAHQVRTPTLVLHSELDFRCPLEQATRYYLSLRTAGVDAEMLIFPGENHELTRAGQPRHRVERFDAVLDWWRRVLPTD